MKYFLAAFLFAFPALAHHPYEWVMKYENAKGQSCCHSTDATPISHAAANSASIGSVILSPFGPVVVNKIYQTQDHEGRPWITTYGCLFRNFGG